MSKQTDLLGRKFGELTVISPRSERLRDEIAYVCKCTCGEETLATRGQLLSGRKKSCGCLRKKSPTNVIDLTGMKFGKLTVIERAGKTEKDNALWKCICDCGNPFPARGTGLRRGEITSCGCSRSEQMANARKVLTEEKTIDCVQVPILTKKVRSDSITGHKGVYKRIRQGKEYYEANIAVKGKRKYAGPFAKLEDAIAARKRLEEQYHEPYIKELEEKNEGN